MPMGPTIDVVIPVFNQPGVTQRCLCSVLASRASNASQFELVVIDDASDDPDTQACLRGFCRDSGITLITNPVNRGFTQTANTGLRLHPGRDVLLLNSDTEVFGSWLDRLARAAYSGARVATVNPLTNASHISGYPHRTGNDDAVVEVDDPTLDALASANAGRYAQVHTTVGFCMYIRRDCLDEIGCLDQRHFPIGYGEESDFCYRARAVGWQHLVAGDVFVRHFAGRSFRERQRALMKQMLEQFGRLHPEYSALDEQFQRRDPVRTLRSSLDLARVRRLLNGRRVLNVRTVPPNECRTGAGDDVCLLFGAADGRIGLSVNTGASLPNLPTFALPRDISSFNATMRRLGTTTIRFDSAWALSLVQQTVDGLACEVTLGPTVDVCTEGRPAPRVRSSSCSKPIIPRPQATSTVGSRKAVR
jgi:GT2 family glycosyltransferase